MFRKNDEAKKQWSIEKVYQCKEIQLSLLEDAYYMLKGKGKLLYSTCSFSIQENEEVISEFLSKHPDMNIVPIKLNEIYNDTISLKGGLRLYPYKFNGEGQTIFVLQKNSPESFISPKLLKPTRASRELIAFLDSINFKYNKENISNHNGGNRKSKRWLCCGWHDIFTADSRC